MKTLREASKKIGSSSSIAIFSHVSPDGDSVGSSLALYLCLKNMDKVAYVFIDDNVPNIYKFLKGSNEIMFPVQGKNNKFDCAIFLDCADNLRAGNLAYQISQNAHVTVNIDHHISNTNFADVNVVDPEASATGELVYKLILGMQEKITPEIATALYTAIVTDTGSFRYDNTNSSTLKIASELIDCGVDISKIRINVWESKSINSIKCLSQVLSTLQISSSGKIAWVVARKSIIDSLGVNKSELDGMINYPKSISGIEIAIFFKEIENDEIKVGLRSKKNIDVSKLAAIFDGGGHEKAAGCTLKCSLDEAVNKVVQAAEKMYLEYYSKN